MEICFMVEMRQEDTPHSIGKAATLKVAARIRELRLQKNLSQTELANRIQSDRQYLYKIETGKVGISVAKLAVIAWALEVEINELFL
jgi:transcriptional regulator with XRE-family HTH domain